MVQIQEVKIYGYLYKLWHTNKPSIFWAEVSWIRCPFVQQMMVSDTHLFWENVDTPCSTSHLCTLFRVCYMSPSNITKTATKGNVKNLYTFKRCHHTANPVGDPLGVFVLVHIQRTSAKRCKIKTSQWTTAWSGCRIPGTVREKVYTRLGSRVNLRGILGSSMHTIAVDR